MAPSEQSGAGTRGPACPECGSTNTLTKGAAGARGREMFAGGLADALGLVSHDLRLRYKCEDCRHEFLAEEGGWESEALAEPCTIVLHREKALLGAATPVFVHLNGKQVGTVANGASIEFETSARSNAIVLTDKSGAAVPGTAYTFEATDGGTAQFRFKRGKFVPV